MLVNSLLTVASLAVGLVEMLGPSAVPNGYIRILIRVGMNGQGLTDAPGHVPQIILKDTSRRQLGFYDSRRRETIWSNENWTHDIWRERPSELKVLDVKMGYTELYGHYNGPDTRMRPLNDGICVAYLAWIPEPNVFNGAARAGAITGDLWEFCGHGWYLSNRSLHGKKLRCGWLDGDNTNGVSVYRIALNTDVLGNGYFKSFAERHPNNRDICDSGVKFFPGLPTFYDRKRSMPRDVYGNKAYVTAGAGAIELCDSATLRGPSMLSLQEGIFCDMATKIKVPICRDGQTEGCMTYNYSRNKKKDLHGSHGTVAAVNMSQEALLHKSYDLEYFVTMDINGTITDDGSDH